MVADPKDTARAFVAELLAALGDRLRSALLYGSVARGEAVSGVSDINLLILVDRVDAGLLRVGSPLARRWAKAGNTAPLLMPWDEWRRASDVFAVELADMKDAHVLLQGPDPLDGLVVDARALRLQAEREIRGKMLQLREGLLLTAEKPEEVGR
ncbi:MAG: nucleotidyltransferase domain-containing protein, partial [Deltaproteobacteria bacterium]|nr:nucleotidyltransferase domain-containing protein [Deltaproteobacteria bacterium]